MKDHRAVMRRIVFASQSATYILKVDTFAEIIVELGVYLTQAKREERRLNADRKEPSAYFSGEGRTLSIETVTVGYQGRFKRAILAELVLSSNSQLTLSTHGYERAAILSEELHAIGKHYQKSKNSSF